MKNYYEILEVHPKASVEVIEKAYKVLVMKYHPDRNGDSYKISEINEAYEILSDSFLRRQYDLELENIQLKRKIDENTRRKEKNINDNYTNTEETETVKKRRTNKKQKKEVQQGHKIGSLGAVIDIYKMVNPFRKDRPKKEVKDKETIKKDRIAIIITAIIIIILGIIAWFIPFTNQFMRDLTVDNPMFSWLF